MLKYLTFYVKKWTKMTENNGFLAFLKSKRVIFHELIDISRTKHNISRTYFTATTQDNPITTQKFY